MGTFADEKEGRREEGRPEEGSATSHLVSVAAH